MSFGDATEREDPLDQKEGCSPRVVATFAFLLAGAALIAVDLAFWHRQMVADMWADLRKRSYPPYEVYETFGIDMTAGFGYLALAAAWVVCQSVSAILYLCVCRRLGRWTNITFALLWCLSLVGAGAFHLVLNTLGWGVDVP